MVKLTEYQKEFIVDNYFAHFVDKYKFPGWKNIAKTLLDGGKCLVPGEKCIWLGGVGNFISTTKNDNYIECIEYNLNIESFLDSKWFKEGLDIEIENISDRITIFKSNLNDLKLLKV